MLSAICHAVSDACARPGTAPHHLLAAATREVALVALVFLSVHLSLVALEAWRWRLGAGGLALEAWRWRPRGPSPCVAVLLARCLRCLSLLARRGLAWHVAWRVSAVQALGAAGLKRGAGLTLKMKTRVNARLPVAPRGATCWYGSTHASYGVPFSSTNHIDRRKPPHGGGFPKPAFTEFGSAK